VTSVWVGLRPLVKPPADASGGTKALSREHTVLVSHSGLVTVTGGKWTTYRAMAEDVLLTCADAGLIPRRAAGVTARLRLVGAQTGDPSAHSIVASPGLQCYGDEAGQLLAMTGADIALGSGVTEAMVRFAAQYEYAIRVEDVLARRARLLFLDAARAAGLAHRVGEILQQETGLDPQVAEFIRLTQQYMCSAD
jgi:glycerol-3-phosphate dehydrogenase